MGESRYHFFMGNRPSTAILGIIPWMRILCANNIFCRHGKIHFTNASALAVKYGTCRAKPAESALCLSRFCLLALSR